MNSIFRAVAKLENDEAPIDEPASDAPSPKSDPWNANRTGTGSALVSTVPSSEWLGARDVSTTSNPFALDGILLERLIAPDVSQRYYEHLVANFHARYDAESIKTIQFVAIGQGAGCSTTAFNFAVALCRYPHTQVLFIDADFRAVHRPDRPGGRLVPSLSNLAMAGSDGRLPVFPVIKDANLFVIPSGNAIVAPLTLFRSHAFERFMSEMSSRFSHIVIDTPPLQVAPESLYLSSRVDGVILVLDCARSRRSAARRLKETIEGAGGRMLGAVLNRRRHYIPDWVYRKLWPHASGTLR